MREFADKCADESPLCPRLEALCENFFLVQWKEMRCACPKTCKLCTENAQPPELTTPIPPLAMESPTRCDPVSFPIDVVLILDGSSSITKRLFDQQILGFAKNFARQLDVSPNGHRLAIVQYSGRARTEIQLGAYNDSGLLETAINAISYMNGGTWTGLAINHAKDRVFDFTRRASKACIVLTDGVSSDRVQGPADQLRQLGVHMIAIGVGPDFNRSELEQIAGDSSHVYTVDTFQNLNNTLALNLNAKICQDAVNQQR